MTSSCSGEISDARASWRARAGRESRFVACASVQRCDPDGNVVDRWVRHSKRTRGQAESALPVRSASWFWPSAPWPSRVRVRQSRSNPAIAKSPAVRGTFSRHHPASRVQPRATSSPEFFPQHASRGRVAPPSVSDASHTGLAASTSRSRTQTMPCVTRVGAGSSGTAADARPVT